MNKMGDKYGEEYEEIVVEELDKDDEVEVSVTEVSLSEDEINYWIDKLENLRETRSPVEIELDDENELLISYDDSEGEEYSEGEDEEDEEYEEDSESELENEE